MQKIDRKIIDTTIFSLWIGCNYAEQYYDISKNIWQIDLIIRYLSK